MPRDLPLGNGDFLVNFDARYQLRDVFYPNVGLENHTVGEPSRFGIWVDGQFSWSGDDGWQRAINYELETLVGDTTLEHPKLGVRLRCRDTVDFDRNIYFKEVTVEDLVGRDRQVRLFQHFDANLYGNDTGDSAYYDPRSQALVHYKGRRYFLISGSIGGSSYGLTSFAIGQKDAPGKEGTWRDAEDGELSRNPVAQGSIDSVGMIALAVPAHGSATGVFWIGAGQMYDEVRELDKLVRERTPASFLARTKDYWRLWANKDESIADHLPAEIARLYKRSTLIIRTQVDNRGAIIAGNDSDVLRFNRDTYSYLWPRDGALVADALDLAGYGEVTRRFFFLCGELITREGYLLHKYNPDGSLGSSWHAWSTPDGQLELPKRYAVAAQEIRDAALMHLWDADRGRFVRTVTVLPDGTIVKDATIDISLAGIFLFGLLPASDERMISTMHAIEQRLSVKTPVGGIARYENDYYFQVSSDIASVPGNPWFVATLWLAEHYIAIATTPEDLERPRMYLDWCARRALPSGIMSEQVHPYTGEPLSVSPLTWSHAAFVGAVQHYARRSGQIKDRLREKVRTAGEVIV